MPEIETTLRDRLAMRRTLLANERTLLAYARTALMLIASGVTLWRFEPLGVLDRWLGIAATVIGIVVLTMGTWRFSKLRHAIEEE